MNAPAVAEHRLAQFFFLALFERGAAWAEIEEEITRTDEVDRRWRPAPKTLRSSIITTPTCQK